MPEKASAAIWIGLGSRASQLFSIGPWSMGYLRGALGDPRNHCFSSCGPRNGPSRVESCRVKALNSAMNWGQSLPVVTGLQSGALTPSEAAFRAKRAVTRSNGIGEVGARG